MKVKNTMEIEDSKIAVIGLGYVGLPLAVEFSKKFKTLGFDINHKRISELSSGIDSTLEVSENELAEAGMLSFSKDVSDLKDYNVYIVTVPTPIDGHKQPDLTHNKASEMLGKVIEKNNIVAESTVCPGATEEECITVESVSGLKFNEDFYADCSQAYLGDKEHGAIC